MFVQLGCTYDMHRAHMVRGVLESHGVPAYVWHEAPHIGEFVPGWLGCVVVVPEDEVEAAVKVLNARPEILAGTEQQGAGEPDVPFQRFPSFLDWMIVGATVVLLCGVALVVGLVPEHLERGSLRDSLVEPRDAVMFLLLVVPAGGVMTAVLSTVFLAPLKIWNGDRWMGMIAYLFVRWFLFFAVPVLVGVFFQALESR